MKYSIGDVVLVNVDDVGLKRFIIHSSVRRPESYFMRFENMLDAGMIGSMIIMLPSYCIHGKAPSPLCPTKSLKRFTL